MYVIASDICGDNSNMNYMIRWQLYLFSIMSYQPQSAVYDKSYWMINFTCCPNYIQWNVEVTYHMCGKIHDYVIKWKHFPCYWPFVRGIHRSSVNSSHKGQWRGDLMPSLICAWINGSVDNRDAGDLRRNRAHYGVSVMISCPYDLE